MKKLEKLQCHAKQQRIKTLTDLIYALECSDDLLMTNVNGNLKHYLRMQTELKELQHDDNT